MLSLAIVRENKFAIVEALVLQSMTSTFGIGAVYLNNRLGEPVVNNANQ